ncbi:unnamed protein product [Peniophora sp. CBMAI 1063]|nr:unnamed protein product [Peniophora sp. CBMAI 1063]
MSYSDGFDLDTVDGAELVLQFARSVRTLESSLLRLSFLDGARLLCGGKPHYEMLFILNACTRLRSVSCHRQFLPSAFQPAPQERADMYAFRRDYLERCLDHVAIDSPHAKCWDRSEIFNATHLHYVRDGDPRYSTGPSNPINGAVRDPIMSPLTHLSLVMSTRPSAIEKDFVAFAKYVPRLRHLRLSAPLSQLTASMALIPPSVQKLVLVVDNSVSWNPHLPPPETLPWERLHNLLLSMRTSSRSQRMCALSHIQFMQPALARRLEDEIAQRDDVKREIIGMQLELLDDGGLLFEI